MFADIYALVETYNEFTNGKEIHYEFVETVPCLARSIITTSTGSNSSNFVTSKVLNYPQNTIKFRSKKPIDTTQIISGIRNSDGVIWKEDQYGRNSGVGINGATIFEPRGSSPIMDHTGRVLEYETMLERQEIQQVEIF